MAESEGRRLARNLRKELQDSFGIHLPSVANELAFENHLFNALRSAYEAGKAEWSESILNLLREIRHDSTTVLRAGYFQEIDGLVLADDIRKSRGAPRLPGM